MLDSMFNVYARPDEGGFLFVASREGLEQAAQLVQELRANWPREYVVRDSTGIDVTPISGSTPLGGTYAQIHANETPLVKSESPH